MKVLMVTREGNPDARFGSDKRYGLHKSLLPLIKELNQNGIEVGYLSQSDAGISGIRKLRKLHRVLVKLFDRFFKDTEFVPISWAIIERINMGRLAVKVMAKQGYSHVHCHDPFIAAGFRWFARIRWYACLRQCQTARWGVTEHGFGSFTQAFHDDGAQLGTRVMKWLKAWESKVLTKAHWVINPTQAGLKQLARDLSIHPIPASWYAIPHPKPQLNRYHKQQARKILDWNDHTIYIIAVGRFAPLKRFPLIIEACSQLRHPNWKLVLVGEGDRTPLQQLADRLGIGERVGYYISDDMGLYYSAADIYVSTSLTESFGLANFEALYLNLPAVCTAVGGVPEALGSGARLVPSENKAALVNALQELLDYDHVREQWSIQAKNWMAAWPSESKIAAAIEACYKGRQPELPVPEVLYRGNMLNHISPQIDSLQVCPVPRTLHLPPAGTKILLFAPHFDDETFACAGTLALLKQKDCLIKVVIVSDGTSNEKELNKSPQDIVKVRQAETNAALDIVGIDDRVFLTEPDGSIRDNDQSRAAYAKIIEEYQADWILIPPIADMHRDHISVSQSILKLWRAKQFRERLFFYETWFPIPATQVVDISSVIEIKQRAMQCYQFPQQFCDYYNAFVGLALYRGLYLGKRGKYAEAFTEVDKELWQSFLSGSFIIRNYQEQILNFKQHKMS